MSRLTATGFTLAELLIALLILGEIATFTTPKISSSSQNAQKNAVFKEMIGALSEAMYLFCLSYPWDGIVVGWKGSAGSNTVGDDQMSMGINFMQTSPCFGAAAPHSNSAPSVALYQSLYAN